MTVNASTFSRESPRTWRAIARLEILTPHNSNPHHPLASTMKPPQVPFLPLGIGTLFVSAITFSLHAQSPKADEMRSLRFTSRGSSIPEGPAADFERPDRPIPPGKFREAPTGFDNETNGFDPQGPPVRADQ